ncbi:MAG TPA: 7-carboxy-7-deazaguanine synthase QueE [Bacteroidales bacterium]|jgi:organic radical activating enzyme|nr:7-carboxy-7-deazaguanine synthase QueE [Bacteroidales bacterium]
MTEEIKDRLDKGLMLPLVEEFYTLQGEGLQAGRAAYFVRLGGCDVGCAWCDTKHSWNPTLFPPVETDEIVSRCIEWPGKAVVVTGGEPLNYNLEYFTRKLKEYQVETFLETSGAYPISGYWDWICLSPKRNMHPVKPIHQMAHELKVVIQNEEDLLWAEENAKEVSPKCSLLLQPEWSRREQILPSIIGYIQENPRWRLSLQMHKWIHIP